MYPTHTGALLQIPVNEGNETVHLVLSWPIVIDRQKLIIQSGQVAHLNPMV